MELWIRSQDRKKIIKVDEVKMETVKEGNTFIYSHTTDLGTYATKERALEVLDEIEKILKPQLTIKDNGKIIGPDDIRELYTSFEGAIIKEGATCELKEFSNFVYQMPAE